MKVNNDLYNQPFIGAPVPNIKWTLPDWFYPLHSPKMAPQKSSVKHWDLDNFISETKMSLIQIRNIKLLNLFVPILIILLIHKIMMKNHENVTESFSIYMKNNLENERIKNFLNIDVKNISNNDAKITVFQLLAFPLQNLCR